MRIHRSTLREEGEAIGRYLARLNGVRAPWHERLRRWLRRHYFGILG